jgi:crotonobetainyl-CoA:carnitine CoA-transferase CaiB-like acyl-CoA transferase
MALITPQDEEFAAMCRVFGRPDLISDPRFISIPTRRLNQAPLRTMLDPIAAERPVDELVAELAAADVPVGRVNAKAALPDDLQVRHNQLLQDTEYPAGIGRLRTPRMAAQFLGLKADNDDDARLAPHLGEHGRELLRELGRSEQEIDALMARGVLWN